VDVEWSSDERKNAMKNSKRNVKGANLSEKKQSGLDQEEKKGCFTDWRKKGVDSNPSI